MQNAHSEYTWHDRQSANSFSYDVEEPNESNHQVQFQGQLHFIQLAEWERERIYDEQPPTCIYYLIEWKVLLNNRILTQDTERNLVLVPEPYWNTFLKPKLEGFLSERSRPNQLLEPQDTVITASVAGRPRFKLVKSFQGLQIKWKPLEEQLKEWGVHCLEGKDLRIQMTFKCKETIQTNNAQSRSGIRRGVAAAQYAELIEQPEEESVAWIRVYSLMRSPGGSCKNKGHHCWLDPIGKKHYKLQRTHMRSLIEYVKHGNELQTYEDVPDSIRQQLYEEDQEYTSQKRKRSGVDNTYPFHIPPINITIHPSESPAPTAKPRGNSSNSLVDLGIPGLRDVAVWEYCEWQCGRVRDPRWKEEFVLARDFTLADCLD